MEKGITWVGVDAHRKTLVVTVLEGRSPESETKSYPNDPVTVRGVFGRLKRKAEGDVRVCYEAGPCGYTLQRQLTAMGIACEVIAPSLMPRRPGDRVKTDKRDARQLAKLYRAGELTPIRVPEEREEAVRDLMRCREDVQIDLKRAYHRLGKFLNRHGRIWLEGHNWTGKHWRWIRAQTFEDPAAETVFREYVTTVEERKQQWDRLEKQIGELAQEEPYREAVGKLRCLKGISTVSAMTLIAEVIDFRRFSTPRDLMAYLGMVPSESSSGERRRRGGITKTGNAHARRILIEAAWHYRHPPRVGPALAKRQEGQSPTVIAHARRAQHRLYGRYRKLTGKGKPLQVAVTAVGRELVAFVWAILVDRAA